MEKEFTVRFYSDSLGQPRGKDISHDQRYITLLKRFWQKKHANVEILDRSRGDYNIIDLLKWFKEDNRYFGERCDILILHEGIVDCAPRPIPQFIRRCISISPGFIKPTIIKFIHNHRPKMQKIGLKYFYVKPKDYYEYYREFVLLATKISKKVYLVNIAPTNEKTEKQSPGLSKSIKNYNSITQSIANELMAKNLIYIDINRIILEHPAGINRFIMEDGHHITVEGHQIYANEIIKNESVGD